jgi:peptide/nickel transport system substrate-binding protein
LDVIKGYSELVAGKTKTLSGLVAGDGLVRITTNAPDAELPLTLASPVYAVTKAGHEAESSPATTAGTATTLGPRLEAPLGSGSFKVLSDDGTTLRLVRSQESVAELDEVDLVREATSTTALAAVHDGDADWASVPPAEKATATGGHVGYTLQSPLGAEEFFGINLASPTFANPLFRRAIIVATDRNAVVAGALPGLEVSAGVVPTGVPGSVDDPCGTGCDYSTETAKALLAQAFPTGQIPTVEIDTDDDPGDVALANAVGAQLSVVGIPVKVTPQPFATYQSFITTGRQQLFRTGWVGLWPSAGAYLSPLFRSTSLDNSTAYSSPAVDKALAVAAATADATQRQVDYQALQRTIMSDYAILPLASFTQVLALSIRVHDYSPRLDGTFDVNRVQVKGSTTTTG